MKVSCNCMANVNGVCCVEKCKGEIKRLANPDRRIVAEDMAKIYELAAKSFEEEFA